jgi:hypothetical protein
MFRVRSVFVGACFCTNTLHRPSWGAKRKGTPRLRASSLMRLPESSPISSPPRPPPPTPPLPPDGFSPTGKQTSPLHPPRTQLSTTLPISENPKSLSCCSGTASSARATAGGGGSIGIRCPGWADTECLSGCRIVRVCVCVCVRAYVASEYRVFADITAAATSTYACDCDGGGARGGDAYNKHKRKRGRHLSILIRTARVCPPGAVGCLPCG